MLRKFSAILVVAGLFCCLTPPGFADETTFPYEVLRIAVTGADNGIDTNNDNKLSQAEIAAVTALTLTEDTGSGRATLKGIEYFTKLKHITITGSALREADFSANTALETMEKTNNKYLKSVNISKNENLNEFSGEGQHNILAVEIVEVKVSSKVVDNL